MWKPDIAKNINLNSHRSAKKVHKPRRPLRMETLEMRTMFYADPLTLAMPDTPVLVGEPEPAGPHYRSFFCRNKDRPLQINPSRIAIRTSRKTLPLQSTLMPTTATYSRSEDRHPRIAMCRHLSEFSLTGQCVRFTQK